MPGRKKRKRGGLSQWPPLAFETSPLYQPAPVLAADTAVKHPVTAKSVAVDETLEASWVSPQFKHQRQGTLSACRMTRSLSRGATQFAAASTKKSKRFRPLRLVNELINKSSPTDQRQTSSEGCKNTGVDICKQNSVGKGRATSNSSDDALPYTTPNTRRNSLEIKRLKHISAAPVSRSSPDRRSEDTAQTNCRLDPTDTNDCDNNGSVSCQNKDKHCHDAADEKSSLSCHPAPLFSPQTPVMENTDAESRFPAIDSSPCNPHIAPLASCEASDTRPQTPRPTRSRPVDMITNPNITPVGSGPRANLNTTPHSRLSPNPCTTPVTKSRPVDSTTNPNTTPLTKSRPVDSTTNPNTTPLTRTRPVDSTTNPNTTPLASRPTTPVTCRLKRSPNTTPHRRTLHQGIVLVFDTPECDYGLSLRQRQIKYGVTNRDNR